MNRHGNLDPVVTLFWLASIVVAMTGSVSRAEFALGEPVNLESIIPVINPALESPCCFSTDGLEIYLESVRLGGYGSTDIWVLRRPSIDQDWNPPENLGAEINSSEIEGYPLLSSDGLTLYFNSGRPGGHGDQDIYRTSRVDKNSPWQTPVNLGLNINSESRDSGAYFSPDGLEFYFQSQRAGGHGNWDIYVATRANVEDAWGEPENLGLPVNTEMSEVSVCLSPNGLVMFFCDRRNAQRSGGYGGTDLWWARRTTLSDPWQTPMNLGPAINGSEDEMGPAILPDGFTLSFITREFGTWANWQVPVYPVVDLTNDGRVDVDDLALLIEHWGQNEPAYDMGPAPWGDGIIDAMDLEVLMDYWGQDDSFLVHWKLDETGGDIAYDSRNENHAAVVGDPVWQRLMGQTDGALEFDGIDDLLIAPFILNPTKQPFSVFAWVKGGQAGQTIMSQQGALAAWLALDATGAITSTLTYPLAPVTSDAVITDDRWHHVGLVSDGSGISLYVDDVEVARSDISPVIPHFGDLQIGAGKNQEPGSFFSGLMDDVRIYDRVVKP